MCENTSNKMKDAFDSISTSKGVEKAISHQIKALEKAKVQAEKYEKQLDEVNEKLRVLESEAYSNANLGFYNDTPRKIQDRADASLIENKDYQKLLNQSIDLEDKWRRQNDLIKEAEQNVTLLEGKMNSLNGTDISGWSSRFKSSISNVLSKLGEMYPAFGRVRSVISGIGEAFGRVTTKVTAIKNKVMSLIPSFNKAKASGKGFGSTVALSAEKGIKRLIKMGLAVFGVRSAFMAVRKAINLALESNKEASSKISGMWQSIANVISPIITTVVDGMAKILSYINSIYKAFSGKDLFKSVNKGAENAANSTSELAKNAKEAKRQLAGFDEMQILSDSTSNGNSSGGGNSDEAGKHFDVESFDVSAIKKKLDKLFEPLKKAWSKYGKKFTDSLKKALTEIHNLIKSIGKSFEEVWTNGTGELTCSLILEILTNITGIVGNLASKFTIAWNKAGTGTNIIQNLWNLLNNVLKIVTSITEGFEQISSGIDFSPLLKAIEDITKLLSDLSGLASKFVEDTINSLSNADFSRAGKSLSDGISGMFNLVTEFIMDIDWLSVGMNIGKFISNGIGHLIEYLSGINWLDIAVSIITFLGKAIGSLGELLFGFFVGLFRDAFNGIVNWIGNNASSLWNGFLNGWTNLNPKLSIAVKLAQTASELWNTFKKGIKDWSVSISNKLSTSASTLWKNLKDGWNKLKNKVLNISFSISEIIGDIKSWLNKNFITKANKYLPSFMQIPKLARGGIVNTPTQFIAGEAGKEAVLPLQNNTGWMDELADKIAERVYTNDNQGNMTIILKVGDQEFYRWLINMQRKNNLIMNGG